MIKTHAMVQAELDAESAHVQNLLADERAADAQMHATIAAGDAQDAATWAAIAATPEGLEYAMRRVARGR